MRILFYVPHHTGHHFAYLARMLPGFLDLPVEIVVATTREALESAEYAKTLAVFGERLKMAPICTARPAGPVQDARHRLKELKQAIRTIEPDHVAVCYADGLWDQACAATLCGWRPWPRELTVEGWIYRGRFGDSDDRRMKSVIRRMLFKRLLRQGLFAKLHLHHELLYEFARRPAGKSPTEVVLAPDPIEIHPLISGDEARRELGVAGAGPWIGVAGVIAKFKGAPLLLEAYRRLREKDRESKVRALLAGPHEDEMREMLGQSPYGEWVADGSIVSVDRFLTEREMYLAAAAVDVVVAAYPNHQNRSSIILWAAAAGRPCVGSDASCVGHVIRQERLGATCDVLDTEALAKTVSATLKSPWTEGDVQRVRKYAEWHRVENYQSASSELLRRRLAQAAGD